nr:MAG TPA: hypothetical protein [Caudoviricetes sp.]
MTEGQCDGNLLSKIILHDFVLFTLKCAGNHHRAFLLGGN